jgi:hypothetical protein
MSGKELVIVTVIVLSGCSSVKKAEVRVPVKSSDSSLELTKRVLNRNLTTGNFNIMKAEVEIQNNGDSQKLIASMKYRVQGNYLLTIRNRTGIEAARVYITHDTVLINDRIYRKLYCGSNDYLVKKYGIATNSLPLVVGDYINGLSEVDILKDCSSGISQIQGYLDSKEIWYYIDCNKSKVTAVTISDKAGTAGINMEFSDFTNSGNYSYPEKISIEDIMEKTKIIIKIISVDFNDSDQIEFIPGKNYERIFLK